MLSHARPIYAAILGSDALLASRPHDVVQLTHACHSVGFDIVVPVSWGEEVIAMQLADHLATRETPQTCVASVCPLVAERMSESPTETPALRTVPPAVATARYVRAAMQPRQVHVTYVGACPGASNPEIDVHCLPDTLFTRLIDAGIDVARQPRQLDGQLPVERSRYASVPGGVPHANWLIAHVGVRVIEAAPITTDVVTQLHRHEPLLIDLAVSCGCVCARDRLAVSRLEPPRSTTPVIRDMSVGALIEPESAEDFEPDFVPIVEPPQTPGKPDTGRRARFAENGLEGDATPVSPSPDILSRTVEPW